MQGFLLRWLITTVAVLISSKIVPGIQCDDMTTLIVASLVLGFCNAVLKPILMLLSLPLLVLTFGLFTIVINSLLLLFVSHIVKGFYVHDWWSAFWGSLIISIVSLLLKSIGSPPQTPSGPTRKSFTSEDKVIDV
jgi:putative membrane protein